MHPKRAQVPAKVVQNLMYMWQHQQRPQLLQDYTNIPEVQVLFYTYLTLSSYMCMRVMVLTLRVCGSAIRLQRLAPLLLA